MLMLYNYARSDNVFEFGQSYQLTLADQHKYRNFFDRFNLKSMVSGLFFNFYAIKSFTPKFPYITFNGVFINFPILLLTAKILSKDIATALNQKKLFIISLCMFFLPFLITLFEIYWSPFLLERYHLDFYYLLCIVSFIGVAQWIEIIAKNKKQILVFCLTILAFWVFVIEFLFFCIPYDGNFIAFHPEILEMIYQGLRFGL